MPELPWRRLLAREGLDTNASDGIDNDDDEDPGPWSTSISVIGAANARILDVIQGMQKEWREDLGYARGRDPDAMPPKNAFEWVMNALYRGCSEFAQGNSLYAIKAGVLTS